MGRESSLSNSVGWQVWNMSKRVSSAKYIAVVARKYLESCQQTRYWVTNDLAELERLTRAMEDCAVRATATWSNVQKASSGSGAVGVTSEGQPIGRDDREVLDRTLEAYRAGHVTEYWEYVDEFKHLMIRAEWEGNRNRWNVIGRAERQRDSTNIIAPDEGFHASDAPATSNSYSATLAKWYSLSPGEADELRRLTSLFDECATEAHTTFVTVSDFLDEIDPVGRGASLWGVSGKLEKRMLAIRSTDSVVEDSLEVEEAINALLSTASTRTAQRAD